MWRNGMGDGWDWWLWVLLVAGTIGFWVLVAWTVSGLVRGGPVVRRPSTSPPAESLRLLDERLARGEIGPEEYSRARDALMREH